MLLEISRELSQAKCPIASLPWPIPISKLNVQNDTLKCHLDGNKPKHSQTGGMNCLKVFLSIDILSILSSVEPSGVPLNQSILKNKCQSTYEKPFEQDKKSQHVIPTAFTQKGKAPFG